MPAKILGLCVSVVVIAGCAAPVEEEAPVTTTAWSFDEAPAGTLPAGLKVTVGEWKVEEDSTAPSGGRVLAQVAKNPRPAFNVVLVEETSYQDIDVSVSFQSIEGEIDQGGGLVWRAKDGDNYYIARYNPLEDNYRVYKVVEGKRRQLENADIDQTPGWHTLRITMKGDLIQCSYDGKQYLEVRDSTFVDAGKIGLWTKADAQTRFDDLKVW